MPIYQKAKGRATVTSVVEKYSKTVDETFKPLFLKAGVSYPPSNYALLAVKETKTLELWVQDEKKTWTYIKTYPVLAASGNLGPKLKEGDEQVPEGIYSLEYLNPNSSYHLSMKINYPNKFDLKWANKEGRKEPGTNIFIHGKNLSIGCLALGDIAIEELFILTTKVFKENVKVIISPVDPRTKELASPDNSRKWIDELYEQIRIEFLKVSGNERS
ncbi:MAG: L,D-transpeptidase family protein [Lentisphaeraceae bacterium]|nr:L,D-transpeptidase family protein [Lentisphaeraceae bacterium]